MFRTVASYVLIGCSCLLAAAAVCTVWLDGVVLDTPSYVRTVGPLWRDAGIRDKAAREIGQHIAKYLDVRRTAGLWTPNAPASDQFALAVRLQGVAETLTRGVGEAYVASPAFETEWLEANAAAHRSLVGQLLAPGDSAGSPITIDVDIAGAATRALAAFPSVSTAALDGYAEPLHVEVLDRGDFIALRTVLRALSGRGLLVAAGFAVFTACGSALARDRRKAVALVGWGTSAAMLLLLAATAGLACESVARMADWHLTPTSVTTMFDTIVGPLRVGAAAVMLAGAVCGYAASRLRRPVPGPGLPSPPRL